MLTIEGDFGNVILDQTTVGNNGRINSRFLEIETDESLNLFRELAIVKPDLTNNSYKLYSYINAGRNRRIRLGSFSTPNHVLTARKNGCVWTPKGKISSNIRSYELCPIEYNGEICPDALWDDCYEKLLGVGNGVRDLRGTPEATTLVRELINNIYRGIGNSFYELAWFGRHPLIEVAEQNGTYGVQDEQWEDYYDQQQACGGFMTMIDELKGQGYENYNVQIQDSEVSLDEYLGKVSGPGGLFERCFAKQTTAMRLASKRGNRQGSVEPAVFLVSTDIFAKYELELLDTFPDIRDTFLYYFNGEFCTNQACNPNQPVRGVLRYKGHLVVCMDEWLCFDEILSIKQHRCLLVTPGVFGMMHDVSTIDQFGGMGVRIEQKLDAPWQGKMFMDTTFKMGTAILDRDYVINASKVLMK